MVKRPKVYFCRYRLGTPPFNHRQNPTPPNSRSCHPLPMRWTGTSLQVPTFRQPAALPSFSLHCSRGIQLSVTSNWQTGRKIFFSAPCVRTKLPTSTICGTTFAPTLGTSPTSAPIAPTGPPTRVTSRGTSWPYICPTLLLPLEELVGEPFVGHNQE